ncbi:MAG TPA: orotate phosphoribosyltransferase [Ruminococcaceae bacterium]|nr:orotate phosphoribosyltransferase [Oscillospiraceae bacterium]
MSYKRQFIEFMVVSGVLTFGDFVTKSGRKTPYFINTGNYRSGAQAAKLGEYYAACIQENIKGEVDALFGPAYKGIPLSVACAIALSQKHGRNVNYCFNRKEAKDHGEGGSMVGYQLKSGDRVVIIEDVITAGTAMRECLPILKAAADIEIVGLVVSADRMERGKGELSAIQEIKAEYDINTYPIVTVREIIETLHNQPVDGRIVVDDAVREKMEAYLQKYGIR